MVLWKSLEPALVFSYFTFFDNGQVPGLDSKRVMQTSGGIYFFIYCVVKPPTLTYYEVFEYKHSNQSLSVSVGTLLLAFCPQNTSCVLFFSYIYKKRYKIIICINICDTQMYFICLLSAKSFSFKSYERF